MIELYDRIGQALSRIERCYPHATRPRLGDEPIDFLGRRALRIRAAQRWCAARFGPTACPDGPPNTFPAQIAINTAMTWASYDDVFFFKQPEMAFEFRMKWG